MLRFLRTLLTASETISPYVHYHVDDHGRRRFCDESVCRPARDPLLGVPPTPFLPYR